MPEMPKVERKTDMVIRQLQVVPYDVLLAPGEKQPFSVKAFNERGQSFGNITTLSKDASFTVDGPGTISADGAYQAPAEDEHRCALITCKMGELTGTARVRIVPPLPWKFDFNEAEAVPLTWLGGRVRWELREENGERFIAKRTVLPTPKNPKNKLGTRSFVWMGPSDLADYTIQADVSLKEDNGRMSDVGLVASGYQLTIRGVSGKLRLDSWTSNDYRTFAEAEFKPKADAWYTMKLTVVPQENQATVRGKIWPRDESEPAEWTIEMIDRAPNLQGTPGVFGNSPDAEIYLDNLQVTSNKN
jgi:hypothetical protein